MKIKKHNIIIPLIIIAILFIITTIYTTAEDTEFQKTLRNLGTENTAKLQYFSSVGAFGTTNIFRLITFSFYNGLTFIGTKIDELFVGLVMMEWLDPFLNGEKGLFNELKSWYWLATALFGISFFITVFNVSNISKTGKHLIPRFIFISMMPLLITLPFVISKSFAEQLKIEELGLITNVQMSNTFDLLTTNQEPINTQNQLNKEGKIQDYCNINEQKYDSLDKDGYKGYISNFKTKEQWNLKCDDNTLINNELIAQQIGTDENGNYIFNGAEIKNPSWPFENLEALKTNVYRYGTDDFGMFIGLFGGVLMLLYLIYFSFIVITAILVESSTLIFRIAIEPDLTKSMKGVIAVFKNTGLFTIILIFYMFYNSMYTSTLNNSTGTQRIITQILLLILAYYFLHMLKSSQSFVAINKTKEKIHKEHLNKGVNKLATVGAVGGIVAGKAINDYQERKDLKQKNDQALEDGEKKVNALKNSNQKLFDYSNVIENSPNLTKEEKEQKKNEYLEQINSNIDFYNQNNRSMSAKEIQEHLYGASDENGYQYSERSTFRKFGEEKEQIQKNIDFYNKNRNQAIAKETFKEVHQDSTLTEHDFAQMVEEKKQDPNYIPKSSIINKTVKTNTQTEINNSKIADAIFNHQQTAPNLRIKNEEDWGEWSDDL